MIWPADWMAPQRPCPHRGGKIRGPAWVPGSPGLPLDSRQCWACLRSLTRSRTMSLLKLRENIQTKLNLK